MKKFLIINLFLLLIFSNFLNTINAITITEDSLSNNISNLNSILEYSNPNYLTEILDDNGNVPAYEYYPDHVASRSIKALKAYDGKIFMGIGDWDDNTGPVKVIYYDTTDGKIKTSGTINDEAIESFEIIDDNLYTTGRDPRDPWGNGSYYIYNKDTNTWEQHLKNGGWIHIFDIIKLNDKIFMCGCTTAASKASCIQISSDNGETFENIPIYKNNTLLPYDDNLRCYNMAAYNGKLYGYIEFFNDNISYNGFYCYDETNNCFNWIYDKDNVPRICNYGK